MIKQRVLFAVISFLFLLGAGFLSILPAEAVIYVVNSASSGNSVSTWPDDATGDTAPTTNIVGASTTLDRPSGVAVDASWIYVANTVNRSIDVFPINADGNVAPTRSITNTNFSGPINNPSDVAVDANWIYVANSGNTSIDVFPIDTDGNVLPTRSIQGASANLNWPIGVAVDANWIYVTSLNTDSVNVYPIGATGNVAPTRLIQGIATFLDSPSGVAVDASWIYVTNAPNFQLGHVTIFPINADGNVAPARSIRGLTTTLNSPYGVAVDASWIYVVASSFSNRVNVYPINADGGVAPTRSIQGAATTLDVPWGLAVSAAAVVAPDITVTDSVAPTTDLQIPFGDITELTTADQTVTVSNDGNAGLTLGNIAVANALAAPFSILNDTCSGQTLAPAANCSLTVRFSPTSIGTFPDSFDIPSDDPDENPVTVSVSGSGVGVPVPDITVTDTLTPTNDLQVPFADLTVGGSNDQTVTVVNDGNANLVMGNVAQANALAAPFSMINDTCSGQTLVATASCTLDVRFAPTGAGTSNDSFDIPSNDPDEDPVTINVSGTGLAGVNNPPSVPNLVSPADGQTSLPTSLDLVWEPSTDPDGDTVSYDVYHCTDDDPLINCSPLNGNVVLNTTPNTGSGNGLFYASLGLGGGIMFLGITLPGGVRSRKQTVLLVATLVIITLLGSCKSHNNGNNAGNANQSYAVAGSNAATTYYWAVVARDGNGGATPSAVWSYTTQ